MSNVLDMGWTKRHPQNITIVQPGRRFPNALFKRTNHTIRETHEEKLCSNTVVIQLESEPNKCPSNTK
jgi:hypothetical protein